MRLPDASRLAAVDDSTWRALKAHLLDIGMTPERTLELSKGGEELRILPRRPLVLHRLRTSKAPHAAAIRMLMVGDPVTSAEARAALGPYFDTLVRAGILGESPAGWSSPLQMAFVNELLMLADDTRLGGDAVMGAGETTIDLLRIAHPKDKVGRLLDLGCGAGTVALLFRERADHIVGTDVNPRAVTLARINAGFAEAQAIEWRTGDMYAPVRGETFDLVVSQPPFISRPEGASDATFLFGGARGDELVLRALAELPPYLAPGGRAVFLVMWPEIEGDPFEARVRKAMPDASLGVTVFVGPPIDMDGWATAYAAREHPALGPEFDAAAIAKREHLDRMGIRALRMSATVVTRPLHGRGFTSTVPITSITRLSSRHVDAMTAARALMAEGKTALSAKKLRAAESASFTEDEGGKVHVTFDEDSPLHPLTINHASYDLVARLDRAESVGRAVSDMVLEAKAPEEAILGAVEQALTHGIVEIVTP